MTLRRWIVLAVVAALLIGGAVLGGTALANKVASSANSAAAAKRTSQTNEQLLRTVLQDDGYLRVIYADLVTAQGRSAASLNALVSGIVTDLNALCAKVGCGTPPITVPPFAQTVPSTTPAP